MKRSVSVLRSLPNAFRRCLYYQIYNYFDSLFSKAQFGVWKDSLLGMFQYPEGQHPTCSSSVIRQKG